MSRGGRLAAGGQPAGSTALGGPQHIIMAAPLTAVPQARTVNRTNCGTWSGDRPPGGDEEYSTAARDRWQGGEWLVLGSREAGGCGNLWRRRSLTEA